MRGEVLFELQSHGEVTREAGGLFQVWEVAGPKVDGVEDDRVREGDLGVIHRVELRLKERLVVERDALGVFFQGLMVDLDVSVEGKSLPSRA